MDALDSSVSSWLSEQANAIAEAQLVTKSTRSKNGQVRSKAKAALISTQVQASLDRSDSQVSSSSLDSTASVASTSSAAGTWSPRTAADAHSRSKVTPRKSGRIRASSQHVAKQDPSIVTSVTALDLSPGLLRESSALSAASFDSDASTEYSSLSRLGSNLSPIKAPHRGSSALLQSQHSILDPLPEKPTDVVRQRKVFGSTYSVGKLDSEAGSPVSPLEDHQDEHAHVPVLPSTLDPPSAPTEPQPSATQAGQLLDSSDLVEPALDESLSPRTAPVSSSAPAASDTLQVPASEGHSGATLLPSQSASSMLPILANAESSGHVAQLDRMEDAQHSMPAHTASTSPRALRSPSPPFRPLALLSGCRSSASLHEDLGHLVQSPATHVMARSLSEIVQQLYANDQLSQDCAHALSMQLGGADSISQHQMQANAELLQRCLARLMLWKDQLLQHCMDHESAMRQYCMDVESAMSSQEQRLMGQAANNLQQRDAALTALHRVEDEVLHLKATVADLHEQLDDKDDFEDSAHLDKESWGEFFALHQ
ncbi:hypothetical protein WJX79_009386 [Trebouxia sp. C0005]